MPALPPACAPCPPPRLVITGATGYIGARLVRRAQAAGYAVTAATRRPPQDIAQDITPDSAPDWLPFDLADASPPSLPADTVAVIHLAAAVTTATIDADAELRAAGALAQAAAACGARLLFVSSQVARADAPTPYGRTKWQIEQRVLAAGGHVLRPGQVYGAAPRALYGTLVNVVRGLPVYPAFLPSPRIQPVHVDDLAAALLAAATAPLPPAVRSVGSIEPLPFTALLAGIARHRLHRLRLPLPVPVFAVRLAVALLGPKLVARFGLERLLSLFVVPRMDTAEDLAALGIRLRPLAAGLARGGDDRRRQLLHEARGLLGYVLAARVPDRLARRYVRAIERLRDGRAMALPASALRRPLLLAALDAPAVTATAAGREFRWRLDAATALAEADPASARRYAGLGARPGRLPLLAALLAAGLLEVGARLFGPLLRAAWRAPLRRAGLAR